VSHVCVEASDPLGKVFSPERIENEIFCSGFYAAKRGTFSQERLATLWGYRQAGEAEMLYCLAPDQTVLNFQRACKNLHLVNCF
jgi:hypothetical protein